MSSIWDFKDTLFRVLAATYAALGEESFRSQLTSIAAYYGGGATILEIETLFTKDVPAKAEQLRRELASRHVCGRSRLLRGSARPHRPPLLDFDDEDISILSPREVEVLQARSNNSLRAPAKRPRVVEGPPPTSPAGGVPASEAMAPPRRESGIPQVRASGAATSEVQSGPSNSEAPTTGQNQPDDFARESVARSRKRRFSEVRDPIEAQTAGSTHTSPPPTSESFGYITKNGEYRCALCQRQLPDENDLKLHEQISKEHTRNLKDKRKVTIGRERLAQLIAMSAEGNNASTSVLSQRLSPDDPLASSPQPAAVEPLHVEENSDSHECRSPVGQRQDCQVSSMDVNQERRRHLSTAPIQQSIEHATSASSAAPSQTSNKGKTRAASFLPFSDVTPSTTATPAPAAEIHTRPTTAQTEIGTLNSPHVSRSVDSAIAQPPATRPDDEAPEISLRTIKDIVRSTQLAIQVLSTFQNCASASVKSTTIPAEPGPAPFANPKSEPLHTGLGTGEIDNSAVPTTLILETLDDAASSSGLNSGIRNRAQGTISGPGIGVRFGIKRRDTKENGKKKDVGEPISVIVLD
ncbi:uncharacterized protein Z520_04857 [Fonsecaea multimorphosa CBS 102226]|uniref:C2H2-type domain-containing protein n=1 Tax=Fonsecaea multimorphosa CBS 102226 TaxID=1442371 RepID=A0A0D2IQM5_9EURO|nr:uncharacterized protein Z520_04857 [Fonsecaea multimorphosa CBS 102226]KIX99281.1 hypothetical protein Z520_04857 [Fonsecaea multimorphosa CBS 102226]OAL25971.1 hypothetical protein AYO22_04598 [Fonsecaea multimorphosa]